MAPAGLGPEMHIFEFHYKEHQKWPRSQLAWCFLIKSLISRSTIQGSWGHSGLPWGHPEPAQRLLRQFWAPWVLWPPWALISSFPY